jgi:ATP-dependent Clp protease ATP-binding subunit ClpB
MRSMVTETLRQSFKPEFLNRIDETVIYHTLPLEQIKKIVEMQLIILGARLKERGIAFRITDKAGEFLAREGYDPAYGARPLKRTIQRRLQDPLALMILDGKFAEGDTAVVDLSVTGDDLVLHKQ